MLDAVGKVVQVANLRVEHTLRGQLLHPLSALELVELRVAEHLPGQAVGVNGVNHFCIINISLESRCVISLFFP